LVPDPDAAPGLLLIPQSSADPSPALPVARRIARRARYPFRPTHRPLTLYRPWASLQAFWDMVERRVDSLDRPYLAFALRSGEAESDNMRRAAASLEHLLEHPFAARLRFTDPASCVEELGPGSSTK